MAKRDRTRQSAAKAALLQGPLTLREINAVTVQGRSSRSMVRTAGEHGASGTQSYRGTLLNTDYNRLFDGRNGIALYDQMEKSDGQVGAAVDIVKLPLRAATWRAIPPEDASKEEKAIAEFVHFALFGEGAMLEDWDFVLRHLLMRVDKGFGLVEKVWMFDEERGMLRFDRLAPRLPTTVNRWITHPNGRLKEIEQYVSIENKFDYKIIPIEYAIPTVREREGDNYFGRSVLRRIYKHWFYKDEAYRIDGVRLDRYGVGIPVAEIDATHPTEEDELTEIENMLMSMRSNERGYIMTPSTVKFRILVPEGGHGGAMGLMDSVKHHDTMIVRGVLATFMSDHAEGLNTNRTRTLADIFLHSLKAEAKAITGDLAGHAVKPLCDFNFDMTQYRYPMIQVSGIDDITPETYAKDLPLLVTAGLVTPDDNVENMLRRLFGLEPMLKGYLRGTTKPEPPPKTGAGGDNDEEVDDEDTDDDEPIEASIVEAAMQGARNIVDAAYRKSGDVGPPPQLPPITIIVKGKKVRPIELYKGQPRQKGGKFGQGKLAKGETTSTPEQRGKLTMSKAEERDKGFQKHYQAALVNGRDDDASDFERSNPVAVARAARDADRDFEEQRQRLGKDFTEPGGSEFDHRDSATGKYTPERAALHDEIVNHYVSKFGPPQENPRAIVTGGLPGAGKTVGLRKTVDDLDSFVNINADDIKAMLPGYRGTNAGYLHEESDHVAKIAFASAVKSRQNVIVDVTMKSRGSMVADLSDGLEGRIRALKERGYAVSMQFTDVTIKTSRERAMRRYVKEGRFVPPSYISTARSKTATSKNRETFEALKSVVDSWRHFDNNTNLTLVGSSSGEGS